MTTIEGFRCAPRWSLLAAGIMVIGFSVGFADPAGAATRFVAVTGNDAANTCLSSGSPCKTITRALTQAVASDTVSVAAGTYNLAIGESFPVNISTNVTLTGAGAGSTIIDATGANTTVITVGVGATATISGVTITGGHVSCSVSGCSAVGGGLNNVGTLTLTNSTVSGNAASCTKSGSGSCGALGSGLSNGHTLALTNSTVSGNTASCTNSGGDTTDCQVYGGGLFNDSNSTLTLTNSTVSGNTASCTNSGGTNSSCTAAGGSLFNSVTGSTLTLTNSTVSGNTASCTNSGGTGSLCVARGGGFFNAFGGMLTITYSTVTANTVTCSGSSCFAQGGGLFNNGGGGALKNTIIAKQLGGPDCFGALTSNGFNLVSDTTCGLTQPSDKPGATNPLLGPLQNNGGPTQTHALLPGSPAINAGTNSGSPSTDQRGFARPQGGTCDIGAFEFGVIVAAVQLNGSTFHTGQQLTYQATLNPGLTPTQVDIYLGALLPDGVTFLSLVQPAPGTVVIGLGPSPVPYLTNVALAPLAVPFPYTFTGPEPVGTYITYAGLAVAGSNPFVPANQLSLAIQAFQFTP